jgi:hypothetical protein
MALLPFSGDVRGDTYSDGSPLTSPEDGRRATFRNVVVLYFYIFIYFIQTMDKVQMTVGSQCYTPSSEPLRIHLYFIKCVFSLM